MSIRLSIYRFLAEFFEGRAIAAARRHSLRLKARADEKALDFANIKRAEFKECRELWEGQSE